MRKNTTCKFNYAITREDKMMIAVNNEVDETYINKILSGTFTPKGVEAKTKADKILAEIKGAAEFNRTHDTYKYLLLEADELAYEAEPEPQPQPENTEPKPIVPAWGETLTNQTAA